MRRRRTSVVLTRVRGLSSECDWRWRRHQIRLPLTLSDGRPTAAVSARPKINNAFSTSPPATLVDARPPPCAHVGDVQLEPERRREVRTNIDRRVRAS
jgi:hypothetical protein